MGLLRLILAIAVVLEHSSQVFGYTLVGGRLAVQAFYIISGFYMSLILNEKYLGAGSYKLFITNRFLRLFPVYWTVLALTVLSSVFIYFYSGGSTVGKLNLYIEHFHSMGLGNFLLAVFSNIFLFFQDAFYFFGLNLDNGSLYFTKYFGDAELPFARFLLVPQAWTVGVELMFYLIAPFIVRRSLKPVFAILLLSLLLRFFLYSKGYSHDPWTFRFFPTELFFFLLGNVSYRLYKKINWQAVKAIYQKSAFYLMVVVTFLYSLLQVEEMYKYGVYIFVFTLCLPFVFEWTKSWKRDRYIGELSYPVYIVHMLVLYFIDTVHIPEIAGGKGVSAILLSLIAAILLNELIAKKIETVRQKRVLTAQRIS